MRLLYSSSCGLIENLSCNKLFSFVILVQFVVFYNLTSRVYFYFISAGEQSRGEGYRRVEKR